MIYVKAHTGSIYQLDGPDKDDNYVLTYLYQTVPNNEKPFIYKGKQLKDCTEFKLCQILTFEEMIQELKKLLADLKNEFPVWPKEIVKALENEVREVLSIPLPGEQELVNQLFEKAMEEFGETLEKLVDEEPEIEW